ncbi:hypothetical protein GF407_17500 [candidate division KSB1 bacterium]|nr:hypothetical protein [candidate division KSB1 bacterium]
MVPYVLSGEKFIDGKPENEKLKIIRFLVLIKNQRIMLFFVAQLLTISREEFMKITLLILVILITITFCGSLQAQLDVKDDSHNLLMRVTNAGNVGIGNANPGAKLDINGSSTYSHPNGATYKGGLYSVDTGLLSSDSHIAVEGVTEHYTGDNNTVRIATHGTLTEWGSTSTLISGGALGYQNYNELNNPPWIAGVQGSVYDAAASYPSEIRTAAGYFINNRNSSRDFGIYCDGQVRLKGGPQGSDMDGYIAFGANTNASIGKNTALGRLYITHTSGDIDLYANNVRFRGSIVHSSDRRFKTDISKLSTAMDAIEQMQSVRYKWKNRPGDTNPHYGFIAQDLERVLPEMVHTDKEGYKSVRYMELIPILVNALKEQQKEIDTLKSIIAD